MNIDTLINGDCLVDMGDIDDHSVDMILCDLPYGTTACKWDTIIPFEPLWKHYKRIIKPNGAIVLTASQPFTSALVMSNIEWFKYEWIWKKSVVSGAFDAKNKPMRIHENVLVFSNGGIPTNSLNKMVYHPQGLCETYLIKKNDTEMRANFGGNRPGLGKTHIQRQTNYPRSILEFQNDTGLHPTQKPVALFEYLIRTYTNEGEVVLDNCAGSFTTAIACIRTKRHYICIEKEAGYCEIGRQRIAEERRQLSLRI